MAVSASGPKGRRRIAVVTGSRADYGLLRETLKHLKATTTSSCTSVCGMHLSERFGATWLARSRRTIRAADQGRPRHRRGQRRRRHAQHGHGVIGFAEALPKKIVPDIVVLLGDRYEILAAASL